MCIVVRRVTQTAVLYQSIRSTNEIFVVAVAVWRRACSNTVQKNQMYVYQVLLDNILMVL